MNIEIGDKVKISSIARWSIFPYMTFLVYVPYRNEIGIVIRKWRPENWNQDIYELYLYKSRWSEYNRFVEVGILDIGEIVEKATNASRGFAEDKSKGREGSQILKPEYFVNNIR